MMEFYVAPHGRDIWSGRLPEPNAGQTDGPLATLDGARQAVRRLKEAGVLDGPATVRVRGGRYPLRAPLAFDAGDAGPITYAAYGDERPVVDGGQRIAGWRVERVNDRQAWVVDLPEVAEGRWFFRSLFVRGARRPRARLPKTGFYRIRELPGAEERIAMGRRGNDRFQYADDDIQAWRNLSDVDVVALTLWLEHRLPVAAVDTGNKLVRLQRTSVRPLVDDGNQHFARYYVEHVFEALTEPGEWYLDRPAGRLYYLPLPGEEPETTAVFAPRVGQLLRLAGDPDAGRYVEWLRFERLTFEHTDWDHLDPEFGGANQAAWRAPAALHFAGARSCTLVDCTVRHVGGYGVELAAGCRGVGIIGNLITDLGAGGVQLNGSSAAEPPAGRTGHNHVTDNHIHAGGRVFPSAVGILARHTAGNRLAHNHIHDLYYTGISVGWTWGYADSVAYDNAIEHNHIHNLGQGLLSDLGGIYLLGVAPGTVVRGNLIHDIVKYHYGGWAIYPDEGSSHLVIEDNVCYDTNATVFNQHYGRENIVRNNIFAFGSEGIVSLGRAEPHRAFTLERNILVTAGQPLFISGYGLDLAHPTFGSDLNLAWDTAGDLVAAANGSRSRRDPAPRGWAEWRALGQDRHSLVADPRFADLAGRDFTLKADSPAFELGFRPLDLSRVGPRPPEERARQRVKIVNPRREPPFQVDSADPAAIARAGGTT